MKKDYYICPHCLTKFPLSEVWFKCLEPPGKSKINHESYRKKVEDAVSSGKRFPRNFIEYHANLPEIDTISYVDNDGKDLKNSYYVSIMKKHIFKASSKTVVHYKEDVIPTVAKCPYCEGKHKVRDHVCPNPECNKELTINQNEFQYIINLAGAKSNGKSVYLGALLYAIDRYLPHITDWNVELDANATKYKNAFVRYMVDGIPMKPTAATAKVEEKIATVSLNRGDQEKYSFIFYDVHGELFTVTDKSKLFEAAKQFLDPNYIIMICDPSNFEKVRTAVLDDEKVDPKIKKAFETSCPIVGQTDNGIKDNDYKDDDNQESKWGFNDISTLDNDGQKVNIEIPKPSQVVSKIIDCINVLDTLNSDFDGKPAGKRSIPFALCVTKSDLINTVYRENEDISKVLTPSALTATNIENLNFKSYAANCKTRSNAFKSILKDTWYEKNLVGEIDNNFPNSYYCAVSARGYNADQIKRADHITPSGVLDAFVWILNSVNHKFFSSDIAETSTHPIVDDGDAY